MFVGVISVSFAAIFIRLADAPALVIAAYRLIIASLVLIPIALIRAPSIPRWMNKRDLLLIVLSSFLVAAHFFLWITSLSYTSIASSVVLVTSHPIFVVVVSYFLWREKLNRLGLLGIILALGGVVLINYGGFTFSQDAITGNLMALLAAISMGAYLIIGRHLRGRVDLVPYLTSIYTGAAIILLAAAMMAGHSLVGYSSSTYMMFLLLALIPQLIGHSSLNAAVRLIPVTIVSVGILGEPVIAIGLGYVILGEGITLTEILGSLLTLGGIFIVLAYRPRPEILKI